MDEPRIPATTSAEPNTSGHQLEQELMLELSQAVSSTLDLEVALRIVADGTARLTGVETAAVYTFEGKVLFLGATTPPLEKPYGRVELLRKVREMLDVAK